MNIRKILSFLLLIPCLSFAGTITDNVNNYSFGKTVTIYQVVITNGLDISGNINFSNGTFYTTSIDVTNATITGILSTTNISLGGTNIIGTAIWTNSNSIGTQPTFTSVTALNGYFSNIVVDGIISNTPIYFDVSMSTNVPMASGTWTKCPYDTIITNIGSGWNSTDRRFIPNQRGWYVVYVCAWLDVNAANDTAVVFYKNAQPYRWVWYTPLGIGGDVMMAGSAMVYLNGSTDYVEVYGLLGTAGQWFKTQGAGNQYQTFSGRLVQKE